VAAGAAGQLRVEGALALVVGPSGAGKDTLLGAARAALADDPRFVFARRVVTRAAMAELEDHDSLDRTGFALEQQRGAFALDWEAHGLCYGVPVAIEAAMRDGRVVVVNTSRKVIELALQKYPRCRVLLVTARPEVRAERLAGRGRESADQVAARLAREGAAIPAGVEAVTIDNSGSLADGVARFVAALREMAAQS
jgi:phosphonate metabolism protein PhnN/1,5-bisphosphokinase (PRPP-forming)